MTKIPYLDETKWPRVIVTLTHFNFFLTDNAHAISRKYAIQPDSDIFPQTCGETGMSSLHEHTMLEGHAGDTSSGYKY